ncbi:MAG: hypothetical protein A4E67_00232 [Syntrophaceae bacterium PtaB.Bin038]|nr:MAG: hypothetical protein A4E67_00232 [Syntrophaceae bacterium PtaB.Bin038]
MREEGGLVTSLMQSYRSKINEAFNAADGDFKIGLSLTIKPNGAGCKLEAGISFVAERIKDMYTEDIDEKQMTLDLEDQKEAALLTAGRKVACPLRPIFGQDGMIKGHATVSQDLCDEKCKDRIDVRFAEPNSFGEGMVCYMSCSAWADWDHEGWMHEFIERCKEKVEKE